MQGETAVNGNKSRGNGGFLSFNWTKKYYEKRPVPY